MRAYENLRNTVQPNNYRSAAKRGFLQEDCTQKTHTPPDTFTVITYPLVIMYIYCRIKTQF
jgi:hypothetical protein